MRGQTKDAKGGRLGEQWIYQTTYYEGLLEWVPADVQKRMEVQLRRSLKSQASAINAVKEEGIPDSVKSQAVGLWRSRYMAKSSKNARRRKGYEQLKSDPKFNKILFQILGLDYVSTDFPDEATLDEASLAELCYFYANYMPPAKFSAIDKIVSAETRDHYRQQIKVAELSAIYEEEVLKGLKSVNLRKLGCMVSVTYRDRRPFTMEGVVTREEAASRLREAHAAEMVFADIHKVKKTKSPDSIIVIDICNRVFRNDRYLKVLDELICSFGGAGFVWGVLKKQAKRDAARIAKSFKRKDFLLKAADVVLEIPVYKRQHERAKELALSVRERVPETPMEAFPLARTMDRHFIIHVGPTNSGKTHDALDALIAAESGCYLGPLRLLAFEQYEYLNRAGCVCSLRTGEEHSDLPGAKHVSSTIEMADYHKPIDVAVIDEAQMLADRDRGHRWTSAILGIPAKEVHVCLAPHALKVVISLIELAEDTYEVDSHERLVPLKNDRGRCSLPEGARPGDAIVVFSRRSVHRTAKLLQDQGLRPSLIYGALPYDVRHEEARRFDAGETDVVVATDAIGMGMNLPIARIIFAEQQKYDGRELRDLKPEEIQQIAGRAGRFGRYDVGYYTSTKFMRGIVHAMSSTVPDITFVPVGIPDDIALVRNASLSDAIVHWTQIEHPEPFRRIDVSRDLTLIRHIEEKLPGDRRRDIATKIMVLSLSSMPFDENKQELFDMWDAMVDAEIAGSVATFTVPEVDVSSSRRLERLELAYKACDLIYEYSRTFHHDEQMAEVIARRNEISEVIMEILQEE